MATQAPAAASPDAMLHAEHTVAASDDGDFAIGANGLLPEFAKIIRYALFVCYDQVVSPNSQFGFNPLFHRVGRTRTKTAFPTGAHRRHRLGGSRAAR
jgi:hypothetical protein